MLDHMKKNEKYEDSIVEKQIEFDDWSDGKTKLKS